MHGVGRITWDDGRKYVGVKNKLLSNRNTKKIVSMVTVYLNGLMEEDILVHGIMVSRTV
jgi:hypothetical protein